MLSRLKLDFLKSDRRYQHLSHPQFIDCILLACCRLARVPNVANMLGVSQATVKTNLKRIFGKTGTARQVDLVKLIAGFAGPFG